MTLRFLLLLRKLASFFRKRWGQTTRVLWCIFMFARSRILPQHPKRNDGIRRRSIEYQPATPPTTVICASRFPPPLTQIAGGDIPIISPTPIQIRQPTILNPEDTIYETQENYSNEQLGADGYLLEGSGLTSRSVNLADHHDEPEPTHVVIPSRPPSQYSYRSTSRHSVHHPTSQYSSRPPSAAGSAVYRASEPTSPVQRPSSIRSISRRRGRSSTTTSICQSVHSAPPEFSQPESWTSGSIHGDHNSTVVSFHTAPALPGNRLRPMIRISRCQKHKLVVIQDDINIHILPPVTTQFVRWVFTLSSGRVLTLVPSDHVPDDWIPIMHPEGALYWIHKMEASPSSRTHAPI